MAVVIKPKQKVLGAEPAPVEVEKPVTKAKVTPVKAQPKSVQVEPDLDNLQLLAAQYAQLDDKVTALKADPAFAQLDEVKAKLLDALKSNYDDQETGTINLPTGTLDFSACSKEPRKVIDNEAVFDLLGKDAFVKLAKIGVTDAAKYLSGTQIDGVCNEVGYTKTRKLTVKFK